MQTSSVACVVLLLLLPHRFHLAAGSQPGSHIGAGPGNLPSVTLRHCELQQSWAVAQSLALPGMVESWNALSAFKLGGEQRPGAQPMQSLHFYCLFASAVFAWYKKSMQSCLVCLDNGRHGCEGSCHQWCQRTLR